MKILLAVLLLLSCASYGQSVLPLRADTVLIEKTGGSGELKVRNSTRDTLGVLVNIGGGKTRFIKSKKLNDSTFVVGLDTIIINGSGLTTVPTLQEVTDAGNFTNGALRIVSLADPGTEYASLTSSGSQGRLFLENGIGGVTEYTKDSIIRAGNALRFPTGPGTFMLTKDSTLFVTPSRLRDSIAAVKNVFVFGMFGQSNMQGYNTNGTTDTIHVKPGTAFQFYQGFVTIANDPIGNASNSSMGPAFARQYNAMTGRIVCLVPSAFSGTSQTVAANTGQGTWDTTGTLFDTSVARVNAAMAAMRVAGYNPIFAGILWGQGENDAIAINGSTTTQAAYLAALRKMIGRYRGIYGKQMPFYIFRTANQNAASDVGYAAVRSAQQQVANSDSLTSVVFYNSVYFSARGLFSDQYHYTQAGYNEMGTIGAINIVSGNTGFQPMRKNIYTDVDSVGIGVGIPLAPLHVVGASGSSITGLFTGRIGINRTTPLYGLDVGDSARIRTIVFSNGGFGGAPSIKTTTFLTLENTQNILINQGSSAGGIPEVRLALNSSSINEIYSGVYSFFNWKASNPIRQTGVFTTTGFGASGGGAKIGNMLFVPGTNFANDRTLVQYGDDSIEFRIRSAGAGEIYLNGQATLAGRLKLYTPSDGNSADSVLVWRSGDSVARKVSQASVSGSAAPALTTNYIGVGASNLLSGSSAYTYDGTSVKQENSGAIHAVTSTAALGSTSGAQVEAYAKDIPTAADQRLGAYMFGSRNGSTSSNITAGLRAYSNGTWTDNVSEQTYVTMSTSATNSLVEVMRWTANNRVGLGVVNPRGSFEIKAGFAAAGGSPMVWNSGAILTTAIAGAWGYDASTNRLNFSPATTWKSIPLTNDVSPSNGQIPIGNGTDYTVANLTAGTGVTVTNGAGSITLSTGILAGSVSQVGAVTTVFTVTIGATQANTTYKVNVTPTNALSAALFYVTNKTTTTFDVTYLAGLTGTVQFDWSLFP